MDLFPWGFLAIVEKRTDPALKHKSLSEFPMPQLGARKRGEAGSTS